ncbi:MAG: DUF2284 domain-containing protein [Candidatus Wallbacteria bacterium]|nr:DUF2284 domain-containing protein [Candidatus Wallbacteria bacterium]
MVKVYSKFLLLAKKLGAQNAKIIRPGTVKTAAWVGFKCRFGCGGYNSNLCCPPHTPTYDETQAVLSSYKTAMLIHCGPDSHPTEIVVKLEREMFLAGYYKAFGLGAGPCFACRPCNLKKCINPETSRPSLESCGIDVYETVRTNGFPIKVAEQENSEVNYYGLLLIE